MLLELNDGTILLNSREGRVTFCQAVSLGATLVCAAERRFGAAIPELFEMQHG